MASTVIRVIGRGIIRSRTLRNKPSKVHVEVAIVNDVPCVFMRYLQLSNMHDVYAPVAKRFKHLVLLAPTSHAFQLDTFQCIEEFARTTVKHYNDSADKDKFILIRATFHLYTP